jgi:pyruvate,orthophosphate dikinase
MLGEISKIEKEEKEDKGKEVKEGKHKWVYSYGNGEVEGDPTMRNLLGGKGVGLAEMTSIGIPVPPGFTVTTEVCNYYYEHGNKYPDDLWDQVFEAMGKIEKYNNKKFGDVNDPLLVSCRSGARVSMPGMMDTILNLGLNDQTVEGLAKKSGNERFAYDSYRRFLQMFGDICMQVPHANFEKVLSGIKEKNKVKLDQELTVDMLKEVISEYKKMVKETTGKDFIQDVKEQLKEAIHGVFGSWNNERAITYRNLNDIPHNWGTAVNIVSMVFGNMGDTSATGVAFTRNPATGEKIFYGEYLINAQGEDVVAGIRTPQQISNAGKLAQHSSLPSMEEAMPELYKELDTIRDKLEKHYKDMQDIEFTIQDKKLYLLQQRSGKRTAKAAVKIASDLVKEGIVDKEKALTLIDAKSINQLLHPQIDPKAEKEVMIRGLPASPGAACGTIVFNAHDAGIKCKDGPVILLREETSPDDITGMHVAKGVVTARGGMTSHAAVVARGMGAPCITGAGDMIINFDKKTVKFGDKYELKEGDWISISGDTGEVYKGQVPTIEPGISGDFETIMKWADDIRHLKVEANAETPRDAKQAREFGAQGIGLVRTEHMFFDPKKIISMRKMIVAETPEEKKKALDELLPYQTKDFEDLFEIMDGLPVTIRLLDPPLHEFLPKTDEDMETLAKDLGVAPEKVKERAAGLKESNPMLGDRGCRLGISRPEITEMQAKAILTAAMNVAKKGIKVYPKIMIPLAMSKRELQVMKDIIDKEKAKLEEANNLQIPYMFGTMIELPRASLVADQLAEYAHFFSFGTNDLTQTTFGISRDDFSYHDVYRKQGIVDADPFAVLDTKGVGKLIENAVTKGKSVRPALKCGICGEHGGDPKSIQYADSIGLDYVSCSPFRIPIARLAAAQAVVLNKKK